MLRCCMNKITRGGGASHHICLCSVEMCVCVCGCAAGYAAVGGGVRCGDDGTLLYFGFGSVVMPTELHTTRVFATRTHTHIFIYAYITVQVFTICTQQQRYTGDISCIRGWRWRGANGCGQAGGRLIYNTKHINVLNVSIFIMRYLRARARRENVVRVVPCGCGCVFAAPEHVQMCSIYPQMLYILYRWLCGACFGMFRVV